MEGLFICAAPHCLKSFLKKTEFESHIYESHADLLQPSAEKEDNNNESEAQTAKQPTPSDYIVRGPAAGPLFSPGSNSELHDREDKARHQQMREQSLPRPLIQPKPPQGFGQVLQNNPIESLPDSGLQGFHRPGPYNVFQQQNFDSLSTPKQESSQHSDKQHGILSDGSFYPSMQSIQPLNYNMVSLLGFPPGSVGNMNFAGNYPQQPWNAGQAGLPFEQPPQGSQ